MIRQKCILRRKTLPIMPCDESRCPWLINCIEYKNCFWHLADFFVESPMGMSVEEIAECEGVTVEEMEKVIEGALGKLRSVLRKYINDI